MVSFLKCMMTFFFFLLRKKTNKAVCDKLHLWFPTETRFNSHQCLCPAIFSCNLKHFSFLPWGAKKKHLHKKQILQNVSRTGLTILTSFFKVKWKFLQWRLIKTSKLQSSKTSIHVWTEKSLNTVLDKCGRTARPLCINTYLLTWALMCSSAEITRMLYSCIGHVLYGVMYSIKSKRLWIIEAVLCKYLISIL